MSSTFAPIDAATISALNAGDERALEQIFREHYPWILEKALERLKGENAAAPRLISATVRELWDERDGFHSSAEIEAFFNEELRHRARAIRARMTAVHRFEKAEGVHIAPPTTAPTADQVWADVAAELHKPQVDPATAAKRRREHRSHEVAEHIQSVTESGNNWKTPLIVAVVATVVALGGFYVMNQKSRADVINQMLGSAEAQQVRTRAGQLGSVTLSDNSTARLGPETNLVIVDKFGSNYRTLTVGGTAVFTVASGNAHEFEARIGDASVFSKGGAFTVRDYGDESARLVRADSGSLRVRAGGAERTLAAGDVISIDRSGAVSTADATIAAQELAWTADRLVIRDVSLGDAVQRLWRWYGMDITLADSAAAVRSISLDVPLESSQAAISAIEAAAQVRFQWVDGKMTFQSATARRR
jgi:ferric-dicitrate binding protein FerR (iron transport regulator)